MMRRTRKQLSPKTKDTLRRINLENSKISKSLSKLSRTTSDYNQYRLRKSNEEHWKYKRKHRQIRRQKYEMSNHRPYPIKPPTSPINLPKLEPSPIDEATAAYNNQIKQWRQNQQRIRQQEQHDQAQLQAMLAKADAIPSFGAAFAHQKRVESRGKSRRSAKKKKKRNKPSENDKFLQHIKFSESNIGPPTHSVLARKCLEQIKSQEVEPDLMSHVLPKMQKRQKKPRQRWRKKRSPKRYVVAAAPKRSKRRRKRAYAPHDQEEVNEIEIESGEEGPIEGHMRRAAGAVKQESERDHFNDKPRPRLKHRRHGPKTLHPVPNGEQDEEVADVEIVLDDEDNVQLVPPGGRKGSDHLASEMAAVTIKKNKKARKRQARTKKKRKNAAAVKIQSTARGSQARTEKKLKDEAEAEKNSRMRLRQERNARMRLRQKRNARMRLRQKRNARMRQKRNARTRQQSKYKAAPVAVRREQKRNARMRQRSKYKATSKAMKCVSR